MQPKGFPEQRQSQPGYEYKMHPQPEFIKDTYRGSEKLKNKVALITGGDSGIGRAVHFVREGADIAIIYLQENEDARQTLELVQKEGRKYLLIAGDIGDKDFCRTAVEKTAAEFGRINIIVNNAAEQHEAEDLEELDLEKMEATFRTNIFSMFYITKAALQYLSAGDSIINTTSITAYRGSSYLLDYSSTKGAIVSFTRSLSQNLVPKHIRVNGVVPGPIWTPLIPATFDEEQVQKFGQNTPLSRAGQPSER